MKKVLSLIVVATMLLISLQAVFAAPSKSAEEVAFGYLNAHKADLKFTDIAEGSFVVKDKMTDSQGITVLKMQQLHNGVPVFGAMQKIQVDSYGVVKYMSGKVAADLDKKVIKKATVKPNDALATALTDLGFTPADYEVAPTSDLVVYNDAYAYLVRLSFLAPQPGNWYYFVDAVTGNIVNKYDAFETAGGGGTSGTLTTSTGTGVLGDTKTFKTTLSSGYYYMQDTSRGGGILTYNLKNGTTLPGTLWYDVDGNFNSATDKAMVDAHYYAAVTFDYYKNTFGRNGYDNRGSAIKSSCHYYINYNNAGWTGRQMIYGDGDGSTFITFSGGIDVVGHELTHAVTDSEASLQYQNESGAISEAMSDLFGTLVEFYDNRNPDWLCGEDIYTPGKNGDALRSLADPASCGDPDHYSKRYTGTSDNGGVHTNSGIINKCGYLIAQGGNHYGVSVSGIGRDKMGAIFYRTIVYYMTSGETMSELRAHAIQAATDLYGASSTEVNTVSQAFTAVGVN